MKAIEDIHGLSILAIFEKIQSATKAALFESEKI